MKDIPDKYYDLAIVDPPYGIGDFSKVGDANKYKTRADKKYGPVTWNNNIPDKSYFDELYRVSKDQIIWGANYYRQFIKDTGIIVWDKLNESSRWSKVEIASNSTNKINSIFRFLWNGFLRGEKTDRIHECQKPVALYEWLLVNYAKKGFKILDTHGGSMSLALACWNLEFDLDICEIDKENFEQGRSRFEHHKKNTFLPGF